LISFKGAQYPKSVILNAVYFYVRFPVSYRDLEEIMAERGVDLDHATLNRWVEKYAGAIAEEAHRWKSRSLRLAARGECLLGTLLCNALSGER
jgi:putative transposase